jgi:DNA mismatch repair ATPase MutS
MAVVKECLENNIKWQNEYGQKTIVLTAIGSFAENYSLVNEDGSYTSSVFQDFVTICDLMVGKKNVIIDGKQLLMAGFGLAQLDKYIRKLQEHDYTIVIYKQDVNGKNTTRSLAEIISPGTFFGQETPELSNNIMCIWIESNGRRRGRGVTSKYFGNFSGGAIPTGPLPHLLHMPTASEIAIGVATIDIFTGKTALFQFSVEDNHNPLTYDELERYVSAYKPSECLVVNSGSNSGSNSACGRQAQQMGQVQPMGSAPSAIASPPATIANDIISYIGLDTCRKIHKVDLTTSQAERQRVEISTMVKCALNAEKQIYQKEVLTRFYPTMSDTTLMESFSTHSIATQSFCFLLDFVYQHSPNLVKKLSMPIYENHTDKLVLANHSLKQLNIIDDSRHTGKLRSVSSLLNNCVTSMGKRTFMYNLNNPTTNWEVLNASYAITEHMLKANSWQHIRKEISTIKDIEKLGRKLVLGKIVPKDFALLVYDLRIISELYNKLTEDAVLNEYICSNSINKQSIRKHINIQTLCAEIIAELERTFILEKCFQLQDSSGESDDIVYINKGISSEIDALSIDSIESKDKLEAIRAYFSDIVKTKEKASTKEKETEYIKIHSTAKSSSTLMGTSRRVMLLKSELKKHQSVPKAYVNITTKNLTFALSIEDLTYDNVGTNTHISNSQINQIASSVYNSKDKLVQELTLFFNNYSSDFAQKFETHLEEIKNYISLLDMLQCKCYIAHTYNYCRPAIPLAVGGQGGDAPCGLDCKPAIPLAVGGQGQGQRMGDAPCGLDYKPAIPLAVGGQGQGQRMGDAPCGLDYKPFINFTGIRHPLIEHIQTNELYVTNDLNIGGAAPRPPYNKSLGGNAPLPPTASGIADGIASGILLFGTNAVGKTSFIKSVGIALIMAQAGLYVPCTTFTYRPYSYIFTRILGNDNLFKGLSTFAAEMSELRTILLQANENSLVLGDELCSGTESDSALSIFTAGLEHLHEKKSTFLFATHFHEIVKFDEIKALTRLQMKHMAVKYDVEHSVLIYDRKLQDGPGDSMYGLEVCKSLTLPDAFLQRAHDIRMKYNKTTQNMLALSSSHFNAQKIVANCEICKGDKASEVHHLQHQKNANPVNNYIDTFHKNHPANLLNICEACHQKLHQTDEQHKVVKTIHGTKVLQKIKKETM